MAVPSDRVRPIWTDAEVAQIRAGGKNLYALEQTFMLTRAHAESIGCPSDLAEKLDTTVTIPGFWGIVIALALQYGPQVWGIISSDLAQGKKLPQILADLIALAFPSVPVPAPMP